ncbi:hypothetical protein E4T44_13141, partial [Aureobasidium sp. EXF-8845]
MLRLPTGIPRSAARLLSRQVSRRTFASVDSKAPTDLDQITTLSNGVRVASEAIPGAFSGIGVYVDAGSRYENQALRGVSHIIDRLAFKSSSRRSADSMLEEIESLGGNIQCASSRESLMYQAATFNSAVPTATALLAETIRYPLITDEEVTRQLETAEYEIGEIWSKPDLILPELLHMAAYKDNTLGNPLLCPADRLGSIDKRTVDAYRRAFFRPERLVVAFAGVEHKQAVDLAEQHFGDMKAETLATSETSAQKSPQPQQKSTLSSKIPFFKNLSTSASQSATVSP